MLTLLYNAGQLLVLLVSWPILLPVLLAVGKYRRRLPARLGFALGGKMPPLPKAARVIWLHALSVGEVTSALPLVLGIRRQFPADRLIVTVATETGEAAAHRLLTGHVDQILAAPLDILPVLQRFINHIQPDVYILVETDFWPNILACLARRRIPMVLVNGRISQKSLAAYRRFAFFFRPMFGNFSHLCMQTAVDQDNLISLGMAAERVHTLGNLKYDTPAAGQGAAPSLIDLVPVGRPIIVAGSTHPGEEDILFTAYQQIRRHQECYLLIVPRQPRRGEEIVGLAEKHQLVAQRRLHPGQGQGDLLVVDTIGELLDCYRLATLAFVGGSLVAAGGHNPIEAAVMGIPVLFGPHMEDFAEISRDLLASGGATQVAKAADITEICCRLLASPSERARLGRAAAAAVATRQGVVARHLQLLRDLR